LSTTDMGPSNIFISLVAISDTLKSLALIAKGFLLIP